MKLDKKRFFIHTICLVFILTLSNCINNGGISTTITINNNNYYVSQVYRNIFSPGTWQTDVTVCREVSHVLTNVKVKFSEQHKYDLHTHIADNSSFVGKHNDGKLLLLKFSKTDWNEVRVKVTPTYVNMWTSACKLHALLYRRKLLQVKKVGNILDMEIWSLFNENFHEQLS